MLFAVSMARWLTYWQKSKFPVGPNCFVHLTAFSVSDDSWGYGPLFPRPANDGIFQKARCNRLFIFCFTETRKLLKPNLHLSKVLSSNALYVSILGFFVPASSEHCILVVKIPLAKWGTYQRFGKRRSASSFWRTWPKWHPFPFCT